METPDTTDQADRLDNLALIYDEIAEGVQRYGITQTGKRISPAQARHIIRELTDLAELHRRSAHQIRTEEH